MFLAFKRVLMLFVLLLGADAFASAGKNCGFKIPPHEAVADVSHGYFLYIFPKSISASYGGCQTVWDEDGVKRIVLVFVAGEIVEFKTIDTLPDKQTKVQICKYENGALVTPSSDCPAAGRMENGFLTVSDSGELPTPPPEKDPRASAQKPKP